jgi:hypothetical protein
VIIAEKPAEQPQENIQPVAPAPEGTPAQPENQIENTVSPVSDAIQNAASSLLNGFWKITKSIFETGAQKVSSLPVFENAKAGLLDAIKNILKALSNPLK